VSITDQLLALFSLYGLPVLFTAIAVGAVGIPFPVSLMLIAAGSFVEQGEMRFPAVVAASSVAAVLGDQVGYMLGRWGGERLHMGIQRWPLGVARLKQAEDLTNRWGGLGIFLSRWLITALGPWINITSGVAAYSWRRFFVWDVLGEVLWAALYVTLGYIFSDRVQIITELLGNLAWAIVGLIVTIILGWKLVGVFRTDRLANPQPNSH